jgi:hypothetical protein
MADRKEETDKRIETSTIPNPTNNPLMRQTLDTCSLVSFPLQHGKMFYLFSLK